MRDPSVRRDLPVVGRVRDLLRAARERVESPSSPGEPMTRQELAEAINAHVYRASGGKQVTAVDFNHVGKWERGTIRWPAARYRAALRAILDVATDRDLGLRDRRAGSRETWIARRS